MGSVHLTPFRKVVISFLVLLVIIVVGVVGYMFIERWSVADSFYMTIITLSTVGFGEIKPLSETGRMFTTILIILGIGTAGYGLGNLAAFFIEGQLRDIYRARKMDKIIEKLRNHIIICGYGHEGRHAGEELQRHKVPFVIIEKDGDLVEKLGNQELLVLHGDATDDDILLKAGVAVARGLIATVPLDADNVFITLTARGYNPNLTIVARAAEESTMKKLHRAGANKVISSREIGGRRMASVILRPRVLNFLDIIMHDHQLALRLEEIDVLENSPFVGKSIRDLRIRERTGAMVIAFQRPNQSIQVNPPAESILEAGDHIIVMGNDSQVEQLNSLANPR